MMKTPLAALAALLLAGGMPLAAGAQTEDAPIHIDNVRIYGQYTSEAQGGQQQILPGFADVAFTNRAAQTATSIEFALTAANGAQIYRHTDVGSFAPGVTIKHEIPDEDTIDADQSVVVAAVTFADGSTWTNPNLGPAPGHDPEFQ